MPARSNAVARRRWRLYAASDGESIDRAARAALKELVLAEDPRVAAAVEAFYVDDDTEALLDTLYVLAKFASRP